MSQDATCMEVGLGLRNIVLNGDPAPPPLKGGGAGSPIFGQCQLWPNGRMDSDVTWCGDRPRPRRPCVRWEPRSPSPKGGGQNFRPMLWPNGWMDQDDTWHGRRPQTRRLCVRWGLSPLPKNGGNPSPQFSAVVYCNQAAAWITMPLCTEVGPAVYATLC